MCPILGKYLIIRHVNHIHEFLPIFFIGRAVIILMDKAKGVGIVELFFVNLDVKLCCSLVFGEIAAFFILEKLLKFLLGITIRHTFKRSL